MSSASKSFLIKDILSENGDSTSSDESTDNGELFLSNPIDLRRYFKHPLYPIPLRPSALLLSKSTPITTTSPSSSSTATVTALRNTHRRLAVDAQNSPLDALFEMTKKTFDKTSISKSWKELFETVFNHSNKSFLLSNLRSVKSFFNSYPN